MIDFGALPPEVNSARMYAGAGSTSLTTAASAWNALAAELQSAALGYENVVTQLSSEEWLGPASASMASAVQPYVAWMNTTAMQAEQAATQASAAAAAFEQAFASVVPPPLIAANRATLAQAVATNVLGQNTGIIAQLEAQYAQMWAQDATAMYTYAGQSAAATKVTPYTAAPTVADPSAPAKQGAATAAATGTSAGSAQHTLQQMVTQTPNQLQNLANPAAAPTGPPTPHFNELWYLLTGQTAAPTSLGALLNGYAPYAGFFYNTEGLPYFSVGMGNSFVQIAKSAGVLGGAAPAAAKAATGAAQGLGGLGAALGGGAGHGVAGALGAAPHVAGLSVPQSWPGATAPTVAKPISAVPVSEVITAPESGAGNLVGGVPAAGVGGPVRGAGAGPRYGFKPTVMARPLSAG